MSNTVKFTVSMPEAEFRKLEVRRRKARKTRSQFVREAVLARESGEGREQSAGALSATAGVKEDPARYGASAPLLPELTDIEERRRRAIAAAGRFRSEVNDLSTNHDKFLEEGFTTGTESGPLSEPESGKKS